MGLVDAPGWSSGDTTVFGFFLVVVPAGLALATRTSPGGLVLARRFWPVVVAVLLLFAVVTLFPLGLRISWPFLGLTPALHLDPGARRGPPQGVRVSGQGTRALDVVREAGVDHAVHEYDVPGPASPRDRDRRPHYGLDAAAALGIDPARVFKMLVAAVDGRLAAAIVPVSRELDLKAFAAALGGGKAVLAEPAEAQRATGYVVGGMTAPLGGRRRLPHRPGSLGSRTIPRVFVSGGRRGPAAGAGSRRSRPGSRRRASSAPDRPSAPDPPPTRGARAAASGRRSGRPRAPHGRRAPLRERGRPSPRASPPAARRRSASGPASSGSTSISVRTGIVAASARNSRASSPRVVGDAAEGALPPEELVREGRDPVEVDRVDRDRAAAVERPERGHDDARRPGRR